MSNKHHERPAQSGSGETAIPQSEGPAEGEGKPRPEEAPDFSGSGAGGESEKLRSRIKELEDQVARFGDEASALKDQYLRSLAEYENFRKRMFREREDQQKYANFGLLSDLVPLLDDLDRAIASAEHAQDYQTLHDGIAITRRQIASVLENKYGLARFESLGKLFDPHIHEAVASEMGEVEEPEVSMEFLPGYKLHERVVRSAKVRVRMPSPSPAAMAARNAEHSADSEKGSAATNAEYSADREKVPSTEPGSTQSSKEDLASGGADR